MSHADRTLTIAEESDESVVLRGAVPEPTDPLPQARSSNLRAWQRRYARGLSCSDTGVAAAVLTLAQGLFCGQQAGSGWSLHFDLQCSIVSALLLAAWSVTLSAMGSRSPRILGHGPEEYRRVWTATFTVFGSAAVISVLSPNFEIGARYLAVALPLGVIWLTVNRMLARHYVARRRRDGDCMSSVLAVGNVTSVRALARSLSRHQADGYRVVGICVPGGDGVQIPDIDGIPSYPHHGDICNAVLKSGADTVALTSGHLQPDEIRDLSWRLEQLDVDLVLSPGLVDVAPPRLMLRPAGGLPLIHVDKPQYEGAKRFRKRAFDLMFSTAVLLAASPVMFTVALAIKITSRGPVFYLSERMGIDGKPFQMIKFRSMVVDADQRLGELVDQDEGNGVLFKMRCDPRVTPVGRFLRRYSIDELPQFINVLRGEMSVVGPRPPLRREVERYDAQVRRRMLVLPGITGLWQVSGRSDLSWEDSVRLDLSYVENWSLVRDMVIVVSTAKAVVLGAGAY